MRCIEIDGKSHDVSRCAKCPCYDSGSDGYYEKCKHPDGDGISAKNGGVWWDDREEYGRNCPLREKPEMAEGGVIDPSKAGDVYLDPPGSNEEREVVVSDSVLEELKEEMDKPRRILIVDEPKVATIECEWMEKTLSEMADLAENIEIAVENGELVMQGIFMERLKNRINACRNDMISRRIEMELKR